MAGSPGGWLHCSCGLRGGISTAGRDTGHHFRLREQHAAVHEREHDCAAVVPGRVVRRVLGGHPGRDADHPEPDTDGSEPVTNPDSITNNYAVADR